MEENGENKNPIGKSDRKTGGKIFYNDEVLDIFKDIRDHLLPFENGDLLRIPYAGELFGDKLPRWCELDGHEQWPLMRDSHNRAASRCGEPELGWLQNKAEYYSTEFCIVNSHGNVNGWAASSVFGVRPAFLIRQDF